MDLVVGVMTLTVSPFAEDQMAKVVLHFQRRYSRSLFGSPRRLPRFDLYLYLLSFRKFILEYYRIMAKLSVLRNPTLHFFNLRCASRWVK